MRTRRQLVFAGDLEPPLVEAALRAAVERGQRGNRTAPLPQPVENVRALLVARLQRQ